MKNDNRVLGALIVVSAALAIGCGVPGKVTGGGSIQSADGVSGDKAHFGFNGNQCDMSRPAKGEIEYHDASFTAFNPKGVKLHGDMTSSELCVPLGEGNYSPNCLTCGSPGVYALGFTYQSTNPDVPGTGDGVACMVEAGPASGASQDYAAIVLFSGPFSGYINGYYPVQGNVQNHTCQ